ncbi:MAG: DinB family protein [Acidobacteria bacterium]|nr:DinB family protein [Acidobacteriota bacterium]
MKLMFKPEAGEFNPYYGAYLELVNEDDIREAFAAQPSEMRAALAGLAEDRGSYAYEEGKWTIKEVLSHIIDAERIFAYRMLRISRGDETPLATFDQESVGYREFSRANERTFADLLEEFELVRQGNSLMLNNMDQTALNRMGTASDNPVSVRALACICVGHVRHHLNVLKERYLG